MDSPIRQLIQPERLDDLEGRMERTPFFVSGEKQRDVKDLSFDLKKDKTHLLRRMYDLVRANIEKERVLQDRVAAREKLVNEINGMEVSNFDQQREQLQKAVLINLAEHRLKRELRL